MSLSPRLILGLLTIATVASCAGGSSSDSSSTTTPSALADVPAGSIVFRRFLDPEQKHAALFTMSSHGTGERQLTKPPDGVIDTLPDWSPDAKRIAFGREFEDKPYEVHVIGSDGSQETVLDPGCLPRTKSKEICEEYAPAWTPAGMLGYDWTGGSLRSVRGEETIEVAGIGVAAPDGSGAKLLTQNERPTSSEDHNPIWSPDGKQLGFIRLNITARPLDDTALFVSDADGSHARRITPWNLRADDPAWSPDGSLISFRSEPDRFQDFYGDLYTVRPDGTDLTKIPVAKGKQVYGSSFSPDSQWLVFAMTGVDKLPDLYMMRRDGSDLAPLTRTSDWESAPDWSPR